MAATATLDRLVRRSSNDTVRRKAAAECRKLDQHTKRMVVAAIKLRNRALDKLSPEELVGIFLDSKPSDLNAVEIKQLQHYLSAWNLERVV